MTYKFKDTEDMIRLAQELQTKVYWSLKFYYEGEEIRYSAFWDYCLDALDNGAVGVTIKDDNVEFIYQEESEDV